MAAADGPPTEQDPEEPAAAATTEEPPPGAEPEPHPNGLERAEAIALAEDEEATEQAHTRRLRNGIISLLLLVALVVVLLLSVPGLQGVAHKLRHVDADTLLVALGLELLSGLGYVIAFQLVFYRAPRRFASRLAWTEMAFGAALPVGGAGSIAIGAWLLRLRGVPTGRIAERSAVLFLLTSGINVIVLLVSGLGIAVGVFHGPSNPLLSWLPAAVGAVTLAFFFSVPAALERRGSEVTGTRRRRLGTILVGLAASIRDARRLLLKPDLHLLGPYAYLLADITVLWVCLDAIGKAPPFAAVALAYQIGYLVNVLPVPGGIGVLDTGLIGMLVLYGTKASTATAAVLLYHAIALWVPTVIGTIAFALLRRDLHAPLVPRTQPQLRGPGH